MAAWEPFENGYTLTWSDVGTPTEAFASGGSHGSSAYYLKLKGASGEYKTTTPADAGPVAYKCGAFIVLTDSLTDGSSIKYIVLRGTSGDCTSLRISKTGTQLQVNCIAYIDSAQSGTAQNILANTWYYYCLYNNNTANVAAWYLSTDPADMGSSINSWSGSNARAVATVRIGTILGSGTWGADSTEIGYDSFDYDVSSMVHTAEDSGGTPQELAGVIEASSTLVGDLQDQKTLGAVAAASSALAGGLLVPKNLFGQVAAASSLAGALYVAKNLSGQVIASSSLSGGLQAAKQLAGAIAAVSTLTGSLTVGSAVEMAAVIVAQSAIAGDLQVLKQLAGTIAAQATLSGVLQVLKELAGRVDAVSGLTGSLSSAIDEEIFKIYVIEDECSMIGVCTTSIELEYHPVCEV
jgi:hypothetical protein